MFVEQTSFSRARPTEMLRDGAFLPCYSGASGAKYRPPGEDPREEAVTRAGLEQWPVSGEGKSTVQFLIEGSMSLACPVLDGRRPHDGCWRDHRWDKGIKVVI
jgi:hypothetical protein